LTVPVNATHLAFADRLAEAAGAIARRYFRQPLAIDDKADTSPVTIADREAEAAMRALIAEHYPGMASSARSTAPTVPMPNSSGCSIRSTAPNRSSRACRSSAP
jgi:3'-phosphoadenosine 5'-phosphosulfate (PAPS) 3'-phosphatase